MNACEVREPVQANRVWLSCALCSERMLPDGWFSFTEAGVKQYAHACKNGHIARATRTYPYIEPPSRGD